MVGGVRTQFSGRRSSSSRGSTIEQLSQNVMGTASSRTSRNTTNCEVCRRTKNYKGLCRNAPLITKYLEQKFGDLITAGHKVLNWGWWIAQQSPVCRVVVPCKTKSSQGTEKSSRKFLEPSTTKAKVISTDNSVEFGKACQGSISESLYINTSPIRNKWYCRAGSNEEWQKESPRYFCNPVRMKRGGLIPAAVLCETFKTSSRMANILRKVFWRTI